MTTDLAIASESTPVTVTVAPYLYRCCEEWEHSGYDDSDWYVVAYNAHESRLQRVEVGSTRYGNGFAQIPGLVSMTPEMAPRARMALVEMRFASMLHAETMAVTEPTIDSLKPGVRVRFIEAHRCAKKEKTITEIPCDRYCDKGQWVNPRNPADKRTCFACKGTGKIQQIRREKVKVEETTTVQRGKNKGQTKVKASLAWEEIEVGSCGVVTGQSTFGQFYRNGYNEPGRHNTTVYLTLDDGREIQAPAKKLRLDKEPPSEKAIRAVAEDTTPLPWTAGADGLYYSPFATAGVRL